MKELMRRMFFYKDVSDIITVFATLVLGSVLMVVVFAMIVGLFFESIDEHEIFNLISPAFQVIVGAFVGLISGIHLGKKEDTAKKQAAIDKAESEKAVSEPPPTP